MRMVGYGCDCIDNEGSKQKFLDHVGVNSWFCTLLNAYNDFVSDERVVWVDIEGIPLHVWSRETFAKMVKKWGEALDIRGLFWLLFCRKRSAVHINKTTRNHILEKFKMGAEIVDVESDDECNVDGVSETIFSDNVDECNVDGHGKETDKHQSEDPFGFYDLLNKLPAKGVRDASTSLCFSWVDAKVMDHSQEVHDSSNGESVSSFSHKVHNGGSILDILDDMVLGTRRKMEWVKELNWNSGGILCIWEASIFKKDGATISDNFIAIYGTWLPRNVKILLVAVYAPQTDWEQYGLFGIFYPNLVRGNDRRSIIMVTFNDVRTMDERLGSSFNVSSARCFDRFIVSSGLVDVKLEGYSFTWSHPSASKMSKLDRFLVTEGINSLYPSISALCLDRHLSDHRPILLREVLSDFWSDSFRFYLWLRDGGFCSMVGNAWLSFSPF
ncbi:RNA-directed DNA polymerase, eukaryota [Tanacetum coccineum]